MQLTLVLNLSSPCAARRSTSCSSSSPDIAASAPSYVSDVSWHDVAHPAVAIEKRQAEGRRQARESGERGKDQGKISREVAASKGRHDR